MIPPLFWFGALRVNGLGAEHGLYNVASSVEGYEGIYRHRGLWTGGIWDDLVGIRRQHAEYAGGAGGLCFADGVVEAGGAGPPVSEEVDVARDLAGRAGRHLAHRVGRADKGHHVRGARAATRVVIDALEGPQHARGDGVLRAGRRGNSQEKRQRQEDDARQMGRSSVSHRFVSLRMAEWVGADHSDSRH